MLKPGALDLKVVDINCLPSRMMMTELRIRLELQGLRTRES